MTSVLHQLYRWRLRERMIRLAWGLGRWFAIIATVLAFACLADWFIDRYAGSQTWRDMRKSSWLFAPADPLSIGETPFWWFRVPLTTVQVALAIVLGYLWLIRPWARTPPIDDFAVQAEKEFPAFDHRLVTAIQLNRPRADTRGMSKMLIGEVTREAGEIASRHNLLKLVDYRRLGWAAAVALPVAFVWAAFIAANPALAGILVKRQALLNVDIPRSIHLENVTPDVWPTGSEVVVRFKVTGNEHNDRSGILRIVPEGEPEEFYELKPEERTEGGEEFFSTKLPPMSRDFQFQARLGGGRTKQPGTVKFENPPQLADSAGSLIAKQILPGYLGHAPDGAPFVRRDLEGVWKRGEVIDALPGSQVLIEARFNKPVKIARLVPIERAVVGKLLGIRIEVADTRLFGLVVRRPDGSRIFHVQRWSGGYERDLNRIEPLPEEPDHDRKSAAWGFATTPRTIGYRIELEDDRGFTNPVVIRRNIRMWEDRPPFVVFKPESTRDPDPTSRNGKGNPRDYEWDMPVGPDGRVQVIFNAHSDVGIRAANIVYRVIPKGVQMDLYPEDYKRIQHPREDVNGIVYNRLPLKVFAGDPVKLKLGKFVVDLGKFEQSGKFGEVEFYLFPAANPLEEPGSLDAAGCKLFEISGLQKKLPDGTTAKLQVGDTVELYVEVFDKLPGPDGKPDPNRPAGYTREAKRKIIMSEADAQAAAFQRDEARQRLRDKLQDIANDQGEVFRPKRK
jgi:hypothetical protein